MVDPSTPNRVDVGRPVVINVRRRRRRSSGGLREPEEVALGLARVSYRIADAVAKGLKTYVERHDRSAREKPNGAIRDLGLNLAEALSAVLSESTEIPREFARAVYTPTTRRVVRRSLRASARINRRLQRRMR
jgi:hypothetical protein